MDIQVAGLCIWICDLDHRTATATGRFDVGDDAAVAQGFFHGPGLFAE
jgi:hypothetical protein